MAFSKPYADGKMPPLSTNYRFSTKTFTPLLLLYEDGFLPSIDVVPPVVYKV